MPFSLRPVATDERPAYIPTMRMIFLHGAPASGKLTIARELVALTGARLFDNHIAIDLARSVIDFGAPAFWELVTEVRIATYRAAARADVPVLITTAAYDHPNDLPLYEACEATVEAEGGCILPVHLSCPEAELMDRVGLASRVARRKLTNLQALKALLHKSDFSPVPRENCLSLDTGCISATQAAQEIAGHFGLPTLASP